MSRPFKSKCICLCFIASLLSSIAAFADNSIRSTADILNNTLLMPERHLQQKPRPLVPFAENNYSYKLLQLNAKAQLRIQPYSTSFLRIVKRW